jgi:hypothetical protein
MTFSINDTQHNTVHAIKLSVVMLSVFMLSDFMLNVVMLNTVAPLMGFPLRANTQPFWKY